MTERTAIDLAALRRRMTEQETISRDDVRLLFAHIDAEQERREQLGADLTALRVLAKRAVDAWSESEEITTHDIPMSALAPALGEDHPGAALYAELQALRADVIALGQIVDQAQQLRYAMRDATHAPAAQRAAADQWAHHMWRALQERLEHAALNEQHAGAALLKAIQGTIGAWERLGRCHDEFLPDYPEACSDYEFLLDSAISELRWALGSIAGKEERTSDD